MVGGYHGVERRAISSPRTGLAQSAPSAEDRSPRPLPGERASNLTEIRLWFILRSNGLRQEATP
jgi:hypothetical protein